MANLSQYQGVTLWDTQAEVLYELESHLREPLPDIRTKSMATFGFVERNYSIIDLRLFRSFFFREYKVKTLPDSVGNLKELMSLDLSHNLLNSLPDTMRELEELQHLYLDFNKFSIFPSVVCDLPYLSQLNFDENKLDQLSKTFVNLQYLQSLQLSGNNFTTIPPALSELKFLRRLNLSRNYIKTISYSDLENLLHLYVLDLRGNNIPIAEEKRLKSFLRLQGVTRRKYQIAGSLHPIEHPFSTRNIANKIKSEPMDLVEEYSEQQLSHLYLSQYT